TKVEYPENKTIHQLFEEQVEKTPNNIAVVYEDQELTYQQLNEKANQLAHYLRTLGVGPDILVAIAVERSLEMIIGLLGILKAGGAYVPLDPDYPEERLQFMLNDTNAPVLITQAHLKDKLRDTFTSYKGKTVVLDSMEETFHQQNTVNPLLITLPHHLAYVIYTSGSTGKPKGVMISHQGLCNRLVWMQKHYNLKYCDRILQKTPFTFDVSVWELFLPLISGSLEIIAKPQMHKDPKYIVELIEKKEISIIHFVPSMLDTYLEQNNQNHDSLRLTITSGENLNHTSLRKFNSIFKSELHNLYGPTEASIDVTSYFCDPQGGKNIVSIGHPISNIQIYILDNHMKPVPIGTVGEIYIGGVGLARGYLNRPDLTAEKFIPNPFINKKDTATLHNRNTKESSSSISLRLYRTGDLARYLPDSNIEFLGRVDDQVKIRGFRIELGEIESVLTQHDGISQAIVMVHENQINHKQLTAYIVPNNQKALPLGQTLNFKKAENTLIDSLYELPNGMPILSLNKTETDFLYEEIFIRNE
ncbi:MAG: amino acid adenylation domain-containing protein, partial [Alphaproteobacteria bacterium]|nr:amino acid adenylation domain-containing protein [Alphaproteobacteria bacterium]